MTETSRSSNSYRKAKNKAEMQKQLISFAFLVFFTIVAFTLVSTNAIPKMYAIPLLLVMALTQVGFQFYYFMHLKDKGNGIAAVMIYGGVWAALLTLAALGVISWW